MSTVAAVEVPRAPAAVRRHPSAWVLWPTVGATWIAFAQVVSFQGLAVWVAVGSLLTALVVLPLALAGRRLLALLAMAGMTFVVPALAEWLGGNTAGPVTRSSLMACATVGAMSVILPTRYPLALVPASLLLLGGALGLGATGSVLWLVGLWSVAAAVTVAMLGPYRQPHLRDRRRLAPFSLLLGSVGLVAVAAVLIAAPLLRSPWTIPGSGLVAVPDAVVPVPVVSPSASPSAEDTTTTPSPSPTATDVTLPSPSASPEAPPPDAVEVEAESANTVLSWLALVVLLLLLLLLLVLLALVLWRVRVWWVWARLRRRLSTGTPEQRAVGAWTWLRLRRARCDRPLPVSVSPDVAVSWAAAAGEPDVLAVATVASSVAFNPTGSVSAGDADRAWTAAVAGGRMPSGSLRARWRWSAVRPSVAERSAVRQEPSRASA